MRFQILVIKVKSVHYFIFVLGPKVEIAVFFDIFSLELLYLAVFTSAERSKKQQNTVISTLGPKTKKKTRRTYIRLRYSVKLNRTVGFN